MAIDVVRGKSVRDKLIAVLEDGTLKDETPLITSGKLDSLGLCNLAVFIEREVGRDMDFSALDIAKEWNTINDILSFIAKMRAGA